MDTAKPIGNEIEATNLWERAAAEPTSTAWQAQACIDWRSPSTVATL